MSLRVGIDIFPFWFKNSFETLISCEEEQNSASKPIRLMYNKLQVQPTWSCSFFPGHPVTATNTTQPTTGQDTIDKHRKMLKLKRRQTASGAEDVWMRWQRVSVAFSSFLIASYISQTPNPKLYRHSQTSFPKTRNGLTTKKRFGYISPSPTKHQQKN